MLFKGHGGKKTKEIAKRLQRSCFWKRKMGWDEEDSCCHSITQYGTAGLLVYACVIWV